MSWRVAASLNALLDELDRKAPRRSKVSDGSIGDAAHATRQSDHNPWVKDSKGVGVVRARDFTHDPAGGLDCNKLAADLAKLLGKHPALGPDAYIIWNRRIISTNRLREGWRAYDGANPHTRHLHVSVTTDPFGYDSTQPWFVRVPKIRVGVRNQAKRGRAHFRDGQVIGYTEASGKHPKNHEFRWLSRAAGLAVSYKPNLLKLEESGYRQAHPGYAKVSPARGVGWVAGRVRRRKVAFIVAHFVNNAFGEDKRGNRPYRTLAWWLMKRRVNQVRKMLERQGYAVFALVDGNRRDNDYLAGFEDTGGKSYLRIFYPKRGFTLARKITRPMYGADHHGRTAVFELD